jgi:transposase-like protein
VVSAFIDAEAARAQWHRVADQLRPKLPKLAAFMDEAETNVVVYVAFPAASRAKLRSTNPIERVNGEIKRRTEVIGIFPNEGRRRSARRRNPARGRRVGGPARPLHDSGNHRTGER